MTSTLEKIRLDQVQPTFDRILVKRLSPQEKTEGGIYIPPTAATEKPSEGIVVSVGPGKLLKDGRHRPMTLKKDDKVYFGKYTGTEIKINDEDYIVMREEDVLVYFIKN